MQLVKRQKSTTITFGPEKNRKKIEETLSYNAFESVDELRQKAGTDAKLLSWVNANVSRGAATAASQWALDQETLDIERLHERSATYDPFSRRRESAKSRAARLIAILRAKADSGEGATAAELDSLLEASQLEATESDEENGDGEEEDA